MKKIGENLRLVMKCFSIVCIIFLMAGCIRDSNTDKEFNEETGIMKFSFETESGLADYTFSISSEKSEEAYLITNTDSLPKGTDVTKLRASFETIKMSNQIKVGGAIQQSGITLNDFSKPIFYEVFAENGKLKKYKIIVNVAKKNIGPEKYIFFNQSSSFKESDIQAINSLFGEQSGRNVAVGFGVIMRLMNSNPTTILTNLNLYLAMAEKYDLPISIKLDCEVWWRYRSDLWNWWDQSKPGYNPDNKDNVEWTDWSNTSAIKIGWLNWGRQIRMEPYPNLMSPKYQEAWKVEITKSINVIKSWYDKLPEDKKYLFGGIVLGWESSIGMTVFHYPNGNSYLSQPSSDPITGKTITILPSRGVQTIGFAAVKTAGIASSGAMTEQMQTEVVRRHLEALSKAVFDLGIPRSLIFTHCGGWVEGESLYSAAINKYSCPGWSFYNYASDPKKDVTVMEALSKSNAPHWGAVEWLLQGAKTQSEWVDALKNSLSNNCKVLTIYNWGSVNNDQNALNGIKEINK